MKKDKEEEKKMAAHTVLGTNRAITHKSSNSNRVKEKAEKEEAEQIEIQRKVIAELLTQDPDLQFDNQYLCTFEKKLK
jgi:hypothetical protein